jgi:hypothetical protein
MGVRVLRLGFVALVAAWISAAVAQTDPLPSWNDGSAKLAIIAFVADATHEGSSDFVPPPERIATFDNDGHEVRAPRRATDAVLSTSGRLRR